MKICSECKTSPVEFQIFILGKLPNDDGDLFSSIDMMQSCRACLEVDLANFSRSLITTDLAHAEGEDGDQCIDRYRGIVIIPLNLSVDEIDTARIIFADLEEMWQR